MRTFSCFARDAQSDAPALTLILAQSLERARVLARRELMEIRSGVAIEIVENGRTLDVLFAD